MTLARRRDIRWLVAQEAYADPAWDLDPDIAFARRILAARDMHEIERQYAPSPGNAHPQT